MSQVAGMNPWLSMWTQPRSTICALVFTKPTYGAIRLSAIYALQSFFFYANWWSLGLKVGCYPLVLAGLVAAPFIGLIWLYSVGFLFYISGRWLRGEAPACHIRASLAWSELPTSINLLMWFALIFISPDFVFIHDGGSPSSLFINLIYLILGLWSLVLLTQSIREVQGFSVGRSLLNVLIGLFLSFLVFILLFSVFMYLSS